MTDDATNTDDAPGATITPIESTATSDPPPGPLARAIAQAMLSIDSVPRRGKNTHYGYKYATVDDVLEVARTALGAHDIAVMPQVIDEDWGSNGNQQMLRLTMEYTLIHGATGATWACRWRAEAHDKGDKAYYKAYSQARKYFLRELLNMSTGEPLDVEFEGGQPPSPNTDYPPREDMVDGLRQVMADAIDDDEIEAVLNRWYQQFNGTLESVPKEAIERFQTRMEALNSDDRATKLRGFLNKNE